MVADCLEEAPEEAPEEEFARTEEGPGFGIVQEIEWPHKMLKGTRIEPEERMDY